MEYVVVVFAILNSAALLAGVVGFWYLSQDLQTTVGTVIQEEVRRQDDRIEKRVAKREGTPANGDDELAVRRPDGLVAGSPFRRS